MQLLGFVQTYTVDKEGKAYFLITGAFRNQKNFENPYIDFEAV